MNRIQKFTDHVFLFLLILLWMYVAASKLMQFETFKLQIVRQHLPELVTRLLPYLLPIAELGCATLLSFETTRRTGLAISASLMILFTGYVGLVLLHAFGKVPCACGGVISKLGWRSHFIFNIFFLLLSFHALYKSMVEEGGFRKR